MILGKGFAIRVDVLNGWVEIVPGLHRRCILYWSRVLHDFTSESYAGQTFSECAGPARPNAEFPFGLSAQG
jgi:hypothetical protein